MLDLQPEQTNIADVSEGLAQTKGGQVTKQWTPKPILNKGESSDCLNGFHKTDRVSHLWSFPIDERHRYYLRQYFNNLNAQYIHFENV